MTSPGLQNKFIVFQPVARSGKCFPNEGTLTINSSAPRRGVRPCGAARPSPSCALPAAERHGPAAGSRRRGAGEGPFHLPSARGLSHPAPHFRIPTTTGFSLRAASPPRPGPTALLRRPTACTAPGPRPSPAQQQRFCPQAPLCVQLLATAREASWNQRCIRRI